MKGKKINTSLADAIASIVSLHELYEIRIVFPDAIRLEEARELHDKLVAYFELSLIDPELEYVREVYEEPDFDDLDCISEVCGLQAVLLMSNVNIEAVKLAGKSFDKSARKLMQECLHIASDGVKEATKQVMEMMLWDCKIPMFERDKSNQQPGRYLQMVISYWGLVRKIILHYIDAPVGFFPNPLTKLVVNLNSRLDIYLNKLSDQVDTSEARDVIDNLLSICIGGEPDTLSAAPEWTRDQISKIEIFLAHAQLKLGSKSYPLTRAENNFINMADIALDKYFKEVNRAWDMMIKKAERLASSTYDKKEQHPEQPIKKRNNVPRKGYGGDIILDLVKREDGWHWYVNGNDTGIWCKRVNSKKYKISHILFNQIGCGWIPHETFYQAVGWVKDVYFDRTGDKGRMQKELNKLRRRLGAKIKIEFRKDEGVKFADNIVKAPK